MTLHNKWLRLGAALAWMGLIFALSAQSRLPVLSRSLSGDVQDVLGHFAVYAVLALLLNWALEAFGVAQPVAWTLVIVALYALSDEFHQSFVPGRHPDPFDVATDIVGALTALAALRLIRNRRLRSDPR